MATIYDVAKACHCSTTTVSKVLNNTGKISKEKRELILRVAKELGYVRSESARSLASSNKSTRMVGVLLHILEEKSITHELFSVILNAFRNEVERNDYDICLLRNIKEEDDMEYINFINARGLDGVFILSASIKKEKILHLLKEDIPMVAFDVDKAKYNISSNNTKSVASLVDYLVSLGHQRICYVKTNDYGVSLERYNGFIEGIKRNNLPFDERMIVEAPFYSKNSAKLATDKALATDYHPTVIMYPDDYTAINAIQYLHQLGYSVPNDMSISGFDGIEIGSVTQPSLVTIRQNMEELGKKAAHLLLRQMNKEKITETKIIVDAEIIKGQSVRKI